jgi:O-succinylbenzoate synthase
MTAPLIERVDLVPYRLPLARVWASARGNFRERRGWLVSVRCGDLRGYGDCAPLPEAGTETAEAAAHQSEGGAGEGRGKRVRKAPKLFGED